MASQTAANVTDSLTREESEGGGERKGEEGDGKGKGKGKDNGLVMEEIIDGISSGLVLAESNGIEDEQENSLKRYVFLAPFSFFMLLGPFYAAL